MTLIQKSASSFSVFNLKLSELLLKQEYVTVPTDRFKEQITPSQITYFIMCISIIKPQLITVNYLLIVAPWNLWDKDQV